MVFLYLTKHSLCKFYTAVWVCHAVDADTPDTGYIRCFNYALTIFIKGVIDLSNTVSEIWGIVPIWERAKPIWRSQPEYDSTKVNPGQLSGRIALNRVSFATRKMEP
jgi:ABC-type bacteriocin/lantibiotic exporter with double-glycine peptidase domain